MEIIREIEFDEQLRELAENYSRMDDLDNAIDWALSNGLTNLPDAVTNVEGQYYLWITEEFYSLDIPKVRILYTYDSIHTINLLSIEKY